ncbi:hypothetical protein FALBO_4382 [Fusarium albosuccineum]|uniref:Uncharacterized protein n=1 Tax=Fusarium albosuccineum TaxID=1237068 RepID=A0A8H4LFK6_9HYPO|nr:hypothetical protein FALBO_4382 [Fusarium albosuccineum]
MASIILRRLAWSTRPRAVAQPLDAFSRLFARPLMPTPLLPTSSIRHVHQPGGQSPQRSARDEILDAIARSQQLLVQELTLRVREEIARTLPPPLPWWKRWADRINRKIL